MAGALHVSDMPEDAPDHYDRFIWAVDPRQTDKELIEQAARALAATHEGMSAKIQAVARDSFSQEVYAEKFVQVVQAALNARA